MKFEYYLAGRYFRGKRNDSRFLSFIKSMAIIGVAVGSAGLLIALSIVHGFKSVINDKVMGFAPHMTVHSTVGDPLFRADTLETWLTEYPEVTAAQPVVLHDVMLQSSRDVSGSLIKGVAPEGDVTDLYTYIIKGEYDLAVDEEGRPGIILGEALASEIGAEPGRTVTAYTVEGIPTPFNTPEIVQFRLAGVYSTGIERFDDGFAIADIHHVRRLTRLGPLQATAIDIRLGDPGQIETVHRDLERSITFPYRIENIYQTHRNIFEWINLQEQTIPFVISVMVIIAAFNLIGTVLMMVLERIRDIGILKTMGAKSREIRRIFLYEGLIVASTGLLIGIGFATLFNWVQGTFKLIPLAEENYYMSYAPVEPHGIDFLIVAVVTLALCAAASWLPARVAAGTDPIKVLNLSK